MVTLPNYMMSRISSCIVQALRGSKAHDSQGTLRPVYDTEVPYNFRPLNTITAAHIAFEDIFVFWFPLRGRKLYPHMLNWATDCRVTASLLSNTNLCSSAILQLSRFILAGARPYGWGVNFGAAPAVLGRLS